MVAELVVKSGLLRGSKTAQLLNGHLLPANNETSHFLQLNNIYTSVISNAQGSDAIAMTAVLRYAKSQAYCFLSEMDPDLTHKLLRVQASQQALGERSEQHSAFRMVNSHEDTRDTSGLPVWMIHKQYKSRPALDQALEAALEGALGMRNLELRKNVTIDLIDSKDVSSWRDRLGFCVSDNHDFAEVRFEPKQLLKVLPSPAKSYRIEPVVDLDHLIAYDKQVSHLNRADYLVFLSKLPGTRIRIAYTLDSPIPVGLCVAFDQNIMALYAESEDAAVALLKETLSGSKDNVVTMNVVSGDFLHSLMVAKDVIQSERAVRRLHTTSPPGQIQWNSVYALNIGMHVL